MSTSRKELEALLAAPALQPPPGIEANFHNPPNRNGLAWFVTTFCIAIATLCLLLRTYMRMWKPKEIQREEVLMFGAYAALCGTAYAGYAMIWAPGYYVHQWHLHNADLVQPLYVRTSPFQNRPLDPDQVLTRHIQLILVYGCCYSAVLPLIKTAILLDWSRIFVSDKRRSPFWWGCIVLGGLQCVWGVACIILLNMQCIPHRAIWEFYVPSKCYDLPSVMLGSATVQVVTDVAMVLLPQRTIWALQMNWQRKLGMSVIFGVGLIACIAACFRLSHTVTFSREADRMYYIGSLLFWAWAEMTAGFFILSVPCLPKFVKESRLPTPCKAFLGLSMQANAPIGGSTDLVTIGGSGGAGRKRLSNYEIGDDEVPLSRIDWPVSQENLRKSTNRGSSKAGGIEALSVSHSGSEIEENSSIRPRQE
ncbi:related to integral membrane protein PTH11 [Fusarium fujikuroi]|nr:related to integral membrane protein PTH11 [Fusarium fujikuroi]